MQHNEFSNYLCDQMHLCRYLLEVGRVAVVPGDAFGAPDCIRISYAASMDTLQKALQRLSKALKAIQHSNKT